MGRQIEEYIGQHAGTDLTTVFDQYLRTTRTPVFEYKIVGATLSYRWTNVVPGFSMPLKVTLAGGDFTLIHPTEQWQAAVLALASPGAFRVDPNFYVEVRNVTPAAPAGGKEQP
jgi:aminopeptidase N